MIKIKKSQEPYHCGDLIIYEPFYVISFTIKSYKFNIIPFSNFLKTFGIKVTLFLYFLNRKNHTLKEENFYKLARKYVENKQSRN